MSDVIELVLEFEDNLNESSKKLSEDIDFGYISISLIARNQSSDAMKVSKSTGMLQSVLIWIFSCICIQTQCTSIEFITREEGR